MKNFGRKSNRFLLGGALTKSGKICIKKKGYPNKGILSSKIINKTTT